MKSAVEIIKKDCGRHKVSVILPGAKKSADYFLTMVEARTSLLEDLKETYGEKVTELHVKMAKRLLWGTETDNVYGVLLDEDMRMVFAFNMTFADYDKKTKKIDYKDIDDLLIEKIKPSGTIAIPGGGVRPPRPSAGGGGMLVRYSLTENPEKK